MIKSQVTRKYNNCTKQEVNMTSKSEFMMYKNYNKNKNKYMLIHWVFPYIRLSESVYLGC